MLETVAITVSACCWRLGLPPLLPPQANKQTSNQTKQHRQSLHRCHSRRRNSSNAMDADHWLFLPHVLEANT